MALTLLNAAGYQSGIEIAETGVNVATFTVRYFPEFRRPLLTILGQTQGFAVPTIPSAEVNIQGEVSGATGLMAATFLTGTTLTNDAALFGRSAGIFLMTEATESQDREGWRSMNQSYRADPMLITV